MLGRRFKAAAYIFFILSATLPCKAADFASLKRFRDRCESYLVDAGHTVLATRTGLNKPASTKLLQSRLDELRSDMDPRDPFGFQNVEMGNYSQALSAAFKRYGVDWSSVTRIERNLNESGQLSISDWNTLAKLARHAVAQASQPMPADPETRGIQRILFTRLLEISSKIPKFNFGESGAKGDSKDKSKKAQAAKSESSTQSAQRERSQSDGNRTSESNERHDDKKAKEQKHSPQSSPSEEGGKMDDGEALAANEEGGPGESSVQTQRPVPKDTKSQVEYTSDAFLRYMYRWELRKYDSIRETKDGLQRFFDNLENLLGSIDAGVLANYKNLSLAQLSRLNSGTLTHESVLELVSQLQSAENQGEVEVLYEKSAGLLHLFNDLKRYESLSAGEAGFVTALQRLMNSVRSDTPAEGSEITSQFYRQLIGELSRDHMREEFGAALLEKGSMAEMKFYTAILGGELWAYNYMGFLRPYLGVEFRPTFVFAPHSHPFGDFSQSAHGPEGINRTDDVGFFSDFLPFDSKEGLILDLAEGNQPFFQRRKPRIEPELSRAATKRVGLIAADVSTSMETRALVRNLLVSAYVDFHTSELKPITEEAEEEFVAGLVIYYATFLHELGPLQTIETRDQAQQFVKALLSQPEQNIKGGTNLQRTILQILDKVEDSKNANDGDLQNASVFIVTDGADDDLNANVLIKRLEEVGRDIQINITLIIVSHTNEELLKVVRKANQKLRADGFGCSINHKFISDRDMQDFLARAKDSKNLEQTTGSAISREAAGTAERKRAIRESVADVSRTAAALSRGANRLVYASERSKERILEIFNPEALPEVSPRAITPAMEPVATVLGLFLDRFGDFYIPREMRFGFVDSFITEACGGENISRTVFEKALTGSAFTKLRARYRLWLEAE